MMEITPRKIMDTAIRLLGKEKISFGSCVNCNNLDPKVCHILVGIDMSIPEILTAKLIGADCGIGHHLAGGLAMRQMSKDFHTSIEYAVKACCSGFSYPKNYMVNSW